MLKKPRTIESGGHLERAPMGGWLPGDPRAPEVDRFGEPVVTNENFGGHLERAPMGGWLPGDPRAPETNLYEYRPRPTGTQLVPFTLGRIATKQ